MRSIVSKKDDKVKYSVIILGIALVVIMFASVLGYAFLGREDSEENSEIIIYNGFDFVNINGLWVTNIDGRQFAFKNNPNEVEEIPGLLNKINSYSGKPLYISSKNNEAMTEIYQNIYQIVERINLACLNEGGCEENLPIKTCKDNFIIIEDNEISEIRQEENCVFIRGPQEKIIKIVDEFLFKILGVRQ